MAPILTTKTAGALVGGAGLSKGGAVLVTLKVRSGVVWERKVRSPGEFIQATERDAARLIASGKAVRAEKPEPAKVAEPEPVSEAAPEETPQAEPKAKPKKRGRPRRKG